MFIRIENGVINLNKVSSILSIGERFIIIKGRDMNMNLEYKTKEQRDDHFEKLNDLLNDITPDYINFSKGESVIAS